MRTTLTRHCRGVRIVTMGSNSASGAHTVLSHVTTRVPRLQIVRLTRGRKGTVTLGAKTTTTGDRCLIYVSNSTLLSHSTTTCVIRPVLCGPHINTMANGPHVQAHSALINGVRINRCSSVVNLVGQARHVCKGMFAISNIVTTFHHDTLTRINC